MNITFINKSLDERFAATKRAYKEHRKRVGKLVRWWNKNTYMDTETFLGKKVKVGEVDCLCLFVNIYYPSAEVKVQPLNASEDAGSGPGAIHTVKFE